MGTRHHIKIKENKEFKLVQYGQWDGYPNGQGLDILKFLSNKDNVSKLKESIKKLRFLDSKGKDKEFAENFDKNSEKGELTEEESFWFNNFVSRDVGSKILGNIINSEDKEILVIKDDGEDWCEGFFTIDLDEMTYQVKYHEHNKKFDINNLPSEEEFLKNFSEDEE
jgi:hypothetical protein